MACGLHCASYLVLCKTDIKNNPQVITVKYSIDMFDLF